MEFFEFFEFSSNPSQQDRFDSRSVPATVPLDIERILVINEKHFVHSRPIPGSSSPSFFAPKIHEKLKFKWYVYLPYNDYRTTIEGEEIGRAEKVENRMLKVSAFQLELEKFFSKALVLSLAATIDTNIATKSYFLLE